MRDTADAKELKSYNKVTLITYYNELIFNKNSISQTDWDCEKIILKITTTTKKMPWVKEILAS